jgi:hypothetical protein
MVIHQAGSHSHLNPFNGIQNKESELSVKGISSPDLIQGGSWMERVIRISEWIQIAAQTIVIDSTELFYKVSLVCDQAASDE